MTRPAIRAKMPPAILASIKFPPICSTKMAEIGPNMAEAIRIRALVERRTRRGLLVNDFVD